MNWKLIVFILIMALVLVFVGFNLDNRCDLSLVFVTFQAVPVIITIMAAYLLGLLSALALSLGRHRGTASGAAKRKGGGAGRADNATKATPEPGTKAP